MANKQIKRPYLIYGIVLSISLFIAAICLAAACIGIYRSGEFSRAAVADSFSGIAVPVYLCLGLIIAGFVLDWLFPRPSGKISGGKQNVLVLKRLRSKIDLSQCDESVQAAVTAQQNSRRAYKSISAAVAAVCAAVFLSYALNSSNFQRSDINASMIEAMYVLLPCLAVSFGCAVFTAFHNASSVEKEISLLKGVGSAAKKAASPKDTPIQKGHRFPVRSLALAVGVLLLAYGFFSGGAEDVLTKAANICTECVGLG